MIFTELEIDAKPADDSYPANVPVIRQLMRQPLTLTKPVTVLLGDNGSGKTTILSGIAEAYGFDAAGGHGARTYAPSRRANELGLFRLLDRGIEYRRRVRAAHGFFYRGEVARELFDFMSQMGVAGYENTHRLSSGQAIARVASGKRMTATGLYLFDEPETSLSLDASIGLCRLIYQLASEGSQVVIATHSPVFAAIPSADLLLIDGSGRIDRTTWKDVKLVRDWRDFMEDPLNVLAL